MNTPEIIEVRFEVAHTGMVVLGEDKVNDLNEVGPVAHSKPVEDPN